MGPKHLCYFGSETVLKSTCTIYKAIDKDTLDKHGEKIWGFTYVALSGSLPVWIGLLCDGRPRQCS